VILEGRNVVAIPMTYYSDYRRDPIGAHLSFGTTPQRARLPWFTDTAKLDAALRLPDMVVGDGAEEQTIKATGIKYRAMVASPGQYGMLSALPSTFHATDDGYWHVHVDLAANKNRSGDAAGIALGRITGEFEERSNDPLMGGYTRIVRIYEVPLAAQIIAPEGDQIYISAITRFILQLKFLRGFNITSFSYDGWQSADASQQLMLAGLVTAGMHVDKDTGVITGLPKPYSVDRTPQPYRELLEAVADGRVAMPAYALLRKECRELERMEPGKAPDHARTGSKDVADPCAGVIGYLAAFGHAELFMPEDRTYDRDDFEAATPGGLPDMAGLATEDGSGFWDAGQLDGEWSLGEEAVSFGPED
jgi:hypothetical protein